MYNKCPRFVIRHGEKSFYVSRYKKINLATLKKIYSHLFQEEKAEKRR
jgi:hypothetical protein